MSHHRKRYLENLLGKANTLSPLLGVLGHRQVGKTTLVSALARDYLTLDNAQVLEQAIKTPLLLLEGHRGRLTALDECQMAPPLFPALKEHVRQHPRPGQFILTGSVRFSSRKVIQESLTGRILNFELLPFTVRELLGDPLPNVILGLLQVDNFLQHERSVSRTPPSHRTALHKEVIRYFECGGLPGSCFIRESGFREKKIREQVHTLLDRDLRLMNSTTLTFPALLDFVRELAREEGGIPNFSEVYRKLGIGVPTQKKIIAALESIFVIRLIPVHGARGYAVVFEDQAECLFLSGKKADIRSPIQRAHFLYRQFRSEFAYRVGEEARFFQYRTRAGVHIPLALTHRNRNLAFIPIEGEEPSRSEVAAAHSFFSAFPSSAAVMVHGNPQKAPCAWNERIWLAPIEALI